MVEVEGGKPGRPEGEVGWSFFRAWLREDFDRQDQAFDGEENDQHQWSEVAGNENQVDHHQVDQHQDGDIYITGGFLTDPHRQSAHPFELVILHLINMLTNIDAGNAQAKWHTCQGDIPNVVCQTLCQDDVHAHHHDRSPDEEDSQFSQARGI